MTTAPTYQFAMVLRINKKPRLFCIISHVFCPRYPSEPSSHSSNLRRILKSSDPMCGISRHRLQYPIIQSTAMTTSSIIAKSFGPTSKTLGKFEGYFTIQILSMGSQGSTPAVRNYIGISFCIQFAISIAESASEIPQPGRRGHTPQDIHNLFMCEPYEPFFF